MLILARHGQTDANAHGLLQGRSDLALNQVGIEQAQALGEFLRARYGSSIERLYCSPLRRAVETAEIIARSIGCEPVLDERLIEVSYGQWEGVPFKDVPGSAANAWRTDATFSPPDGESLEQVSQRVAPLLSEWLGGTPVVAVSHVSPIKALLTNALGMSPVSSWRFRLDNAAMSVIEGTAAWPVVSGFNVVPLPQASLDG